MNLPFLKIRMAVVAGVVAGSTTMLFTSTVGASMIKLTSDTGEISTTTTAVEDTTTTSLILTTTTTVAETTTTTVADDSATTSTTAATMTTETRTVESAGGIVAVTRVGKTLTLDSHTAAEGFTAYIKQVKGNQVKVEFSDGERRIKVHVHTANDKLKVKTIESAAGNSGKSHKSADTVDGSDVDDSDRAGKNRK